MDMIIQFFEGKEWFHWITAIIAAASVFVASTPTPKEGSFLSKAYKAIEFLSLTFGKAKDKGEK